MDKSILKTILSLLFFIIGFGLMLFTRFEPNLSNRFNIPLITLSICLLIIGLSCTCHYLRQHHIISQLKKEKLPLLANWTYSPHAYTLIESQLKSDRTTLVSLLLGIGSCFLWLGITLFFIPTSLPVRSLILVNLIGSCLWLFGISMTYFHYHRHLSQQHQVLIGEQYIYFKNDLHGIDKSFYSLTQITIIRGTQDYLQFIYSTPGLVYGPFETLTIPIPPGQLASALQIKYHYSQYIPA